jgi:hypothetical protein
MRARSITVWYCRLMRKGACVLALALALVASAHAQVPRPFPAGAKLGELFGQTQAYPLVQIGDRVLRLTPGARVYDEHNRTIVHSYFPRQAYVLYVEDAGGEISRVYILRPDELQQAQQRAAP